MIPEGVKSRESGMPPEGLCDEAARFSIFLFLICTSPFLIQTITTPPYFPRVSLLLFSPVCVCIFIAYVTLLLYMVIAPVPCSI
jgi:hypothetical protein